MKRLVTGLLKWQAKRILKKYKPTVVVVTGSVGKTSTTEAIFTVVKSVYSSRKNIKNYNNEFGIPLSIIGMESGGRSPLRWLIILAKGFLLIFSQDNSYPKVLILEMGADRPGDLKYLTSFVPIDIAVVTSVSAVHLEFFDSIQAIAEEKSTIVKALGQKGLAILNHDDKLVKAMSSENNGTTIFYGLTPSANIYASNITLVSKEVSPGISFSVTAKKQSGSALLPLVVGEQFVSSALAAVAVGFGLGIPLPKILTALESFQPPPGRMRIIEGIKQTTIIDDTYNSSPLSAAAAIEQLNKIRLNKNAQKFAVLGDMLELGGLSGRAHRELGQFVVEKKIDYLITVGELSRDTNREALAKGMSEDRCFHFAGTAEAGRFIQERLEQGDVVLVKGSQSMRMEKIVKEIMAEPLKAKNLLVRQDRLWQ